MALSSCVKENQEEATKQKTQLQVPAPRLEAVGSNTATLSWHKVTGASFYNVYFEGDDYPEISIDTFIVIKGLAPQTDYRVAMTAAPSSQSHYSESDKSSSVAFTTLSKPRLESPKISINNISTTGFEASWSAVEMAGSYSVILTGKNQSDTLSVVGDTLQTWTGLVPGSEYNLSVAAVPAEDYEKDWNESEPSVCSVSTPLPGQLAAPAVKVEKATIVEAVLSWDEIEEASGYQWFIDDSNDTTLTTGLSARVTGLAEGSDHQFHVRSVSDNQDVHTDSEWQSIGFTVDASTLTLSDAVVSGDKAKFLATVSAGEEYYMGFVLKAKYLKADNQVDSLAIVSEVLAALSDKADGLVADGTYSTKALALASLVRNKSTRLESSELYHSAQYLCYAFNVNVLNCTAMSELKYLELTTGEHVSAQGSYSSSPHMTVATNLAYGYSTSNGVFDDTSYAGFTISTDNSNVICTEVKYDLITLSSYNSKIGSSFDSSVDGAVKAYFNASGTSMTADKLTKLNNGTSYSSGYAKRSANSTYVALARVVTEANDTLVAVSAVKTCSNSCNWLTIKGENPGKFTVTSALPISSGKTSCTTITTSNNSPELLPVYMETRGSALSDARVEAINSDGYTFNYSSLTSGKTYLFIIQATSVTGETITRACPLRVE